MKRGLFFLIFLLVLPITFSIQNNPPETVLTNPMDTKVINDPAPRFEWIVYDKENDKQQEYYIQISKGLDFNNPITEFGQGYQTFTILRLNKTGTYYWHVKTYDGKKWGEWSSIYSLTLEDFKKECIDGTEYDKCNTNLEYCDAGELISDCNKCGCGEDYGCIKNKCVSKKCIDGTFYGKCNINLQYCEKGDLVEDCNKCGCGEGLTCLDSGKCIKTETNVIFEEKEESLIEKFIRIIKTIFTF